ncbi:MAG TPA: L-fucose isomerase, partial [Verrucomicrobiota bacterium]|nr:L-fucose isomerase [Verrucomicrobiota bacterium]
MKELKLNKPANRLIGRMPKIGIRPAIDGRRRGVRESLEVQTMEMAKAVAQLLEKNLRHSNGLPVECVVSNTTIGGVAEAAMAEDQFRREGVEVSITVSPCWCYSAEVMDMDSLTPKAIWGFNGTERPGAVFLAAVAAAHSQKGLPVFTIYGQDVQDASDRSIPDEVKEKLLLFAKAGLALTTMRGKSYLSMGGTSMGIAGSMINHDFFEKYLGMRVESIDMIEFTRRIDENIYDPDEFKAALVWVKEHCQEGKDYNEKPRSPEQKNKEWEFCVKCAIIARDLMVGNPRLAELGFGEEALGRN